MCSKLLVSQGHISHGNSILVLGSDDGLDVYVMADLSTVNVDTAGLSEGQEGAEAQQVDCGDKSKHSRPRASGLDEIPREIHH